MPVPGRVAMLSRAHLAAGPAGHRRRRRHERLRRRAGPPPGRPRHRGRDLHPGHPQRPAAQRRADPGRAGPPRHRRAVRGAGQGGPARPAVRVDPGRPAGRGQPRARATTTSCTRTTGCPARSGSLAAERWQVPLVHTMHTMAKVKNAALAEGDVAGADRPGHRRGAGRRAGRPAGRQHPDEAGQLVELYGADPAKVVSVYPGVDLDLFTPGPPGAAAGARRPRAAARRASCCCSSAASSRSRRPTCCCARPPVLVGERPCRCATGWSSPSSAVRPGPASPTRPIWPTLAGRLGIADVVRFEPPVAQPTLADWYRAADAGRRARRTTSRSGWSRWRRRRAGRPSSPPTSAVCARRSPTGAPACSSRATTRGTGRTRWATCSSRRGCAPSCPPVRSRHAAGFGWATTAAAMLDVYEGAVLDHRRRLLDPSRVGSA